MNWFTWLVVVVGVLLVGSVVVSIVRPRRSRVDIDARHRERDLGRSFEQDNSGLNRHTGGGGVGPMSGGGGIGPT